jgi:hypothetical protein
MPTNTDRKLRVFLCHSSQDKPIVRELYQRLNAEGWIDPWLDEEKLLPGQEWGMEIEKAVENADAVIVCLSNNSVTKEGYVQRELKYALDIALEKPEGTIFIIPLRLDDVLLPRRLRTWQYINFFPSSQKDKAYLRIHDSLMLRVKTLNISVKPVYNELEKPIKNKFSFKFSEQDIHIGMWAPTNAGKTVYLLSLFIAAMQDESDWLIGFDENTSQERRQYLLESADNLRNGVWPYPTKVTPDPELYGFVFYPSPENSNNKLKKPESNKLFSFWKYFIQESLDSDKKKELLQVLLNDISGESYLNEPPESPLWLHLAGCQGIICLLDPSDIKNHLRTFSNLVDFLYAKVKKEKPDAIIQGQYLPHYISVCFTKMDRIEWRSMIYSPEEVIGKISDMTDLNIRRQLWVHFMPERIKFHCLSSVGFEFDETHRVRPVNVFEPLNDWIEKR